MSKIDVAFGVKDRTYYTELSAVELPSKGDEVILTGHSSPDGWYEIVDVARTYNMSKGELTYVAFTLRDAGWRK